MSCLAPSLGAQGLAGLKTASQPAARGTPRSMCSGDRERAWRGEAKRRVADRTDVSRSTSTGHLQEASQPTWLQRCPLPRVQPGWEQSDVALQGSLRGGEGRGSLQGGSPRAPRDAPLWLRPQTAPAGQGWPEASD